MRFARVIGTTVATAKDEELVALKLLLCVASGLDGSAKEVDAFVAVDTVGAGAGEIVLVAEGSAARVSAATRAAPTDATIVGIVDSIESEGGITYRKGTGGNGDADTAG